MAYNNYMKLGLDNRPVWNTPGSKRIMFVKADVIQGIQYTESDLVDAVNLRAGEKWNLFNDLDTISYSLTPTVGKNGTLYGVEIAFTVNVQTRAKNRLFDSMRNTDLTAIVQDQNHRWWLVGLEQPLRLTTQEQKLDNDNNMYTLKLTTNQRENVKEMSDVFKANLTDADFTSMLDSIDGVTLDIRVASTNGGSTPAPGTQLPNNFLVTITAPPTGYVVLDNIGVVFATAGTTIKLPAIDINGQQHTIKDFTGLASTATITIDGNGKQIDGFSSFRINTDYGSASFTYNNGSWSVSGFVL